MKRKLIKFGVGLLLVSLVLPAGGWLAFVPSATGPGYRFVKAWGGRGDGPGQFNDPTGIAVSGGEVFVSDARNGRIQVFDFDGNFKRQIGKPGKGAGELGRPMNLTVSGGALYVADYWNDRIAVFSVDGAWRRNIGRAGKRPGEFNAPGGVAVMPNGDLLVAGFYNQRIQRLRADGAFVRQWGTTGKVGIVSGEFNYPIPDPDDIDQNCDGVDGIDADGDGHASLATGGGDCNDGDDTVYPGAPDNQGDGIDQDCNGVDG